jgi:hypothetical protein
MIPSMILRCIFSITLLKRFLLNSITFLIEIEFFFLILKLFLCNSFYEYLLAYYFCIAWFILWRNIIMQLRCIAYAIAISG